jgi:hypothetical protein
MTSDPRNATRDHVVAPHSEQQARRGDLRGDGASDIRNHDQSRRCFKQNRASDPARDLDKRRLDALEGVVIGPNNLGQIDQQTSKDSRKNNHHDGREHHVAFGILDILGQSRYGVKTQIGQCRE